MALLVANEGEQLALEMITNKTAAEDLILRLYENDYTPVETSALVNFTEATFTGYSQASLANADWTIPDGGPATHVKKTFTSSAGSQSKSAYGYYVVHVTAGVVLYAERFTDGPYSIVNDQDKIEVTAVLAAD
jgi:hypothetical protein